MYRIEYRNYTWVVVDTVTGAGIVCFPTQIAAVNWINSKKQKQIA
jgi:ribosomal protein L18E